MKRRILLVALSLFLLCGMTSALADNGVWTSETGLSSFTFDVSLSDTLSHPADNAQGSSTHTAIKMPRTSFTYRISNGTGAEESGDSPEIFPGVSGGITFDSTSPGTVTPEEYTTVDWSDTNQDCYHTEQVPVTVDASAFEYSGIYRYVIEQDFMDATQMQTGIREKNSRTRVVDVYVAKKENEYGDIVTMVTDVVMSKPGNAPFTDQTDATQVSYIDTQGTNHKVTGFENQVQYGEVRIGKRLVNAGTYDENRKFVFDILVVDNQTDTENTSGTSRQGMSVWFDNNYHNATLPSQRNYSLSELTYGKMVGMEGYQALHVLKDSELTGNETPESGYVSFYSTGEIQGKQINGLSLGDNGYVTLRVPQGARVYVKEADDPNAGFILSSSVTNAGPESSTISESNNLHTESDYATYADVASSGITKIQYGNRYLGDEVSPTGVLTRYTPFILVFMAAGVMLVLLAVIRRAKRNSIA